MEGAITITEGHVEEAFRINAKIPEFRHQLHYFTTRIENKDNLVLIAKMGDEPAGFLIGYDRHNDKSFYCWLVGVVPEARRKGILHSLMKQMETWAQEHGYTKIKIKSRNNRREMLAYLVKEVFLFTSVEPRHDIFENRICLEKEIGMKN